MDSDGSVVNMVFGGGDGQWVRARNKEGAKLFLAEQEMRAAEEQERKRRSIEFRGYLRSKLRALFRRTER